jgi:hypothetical protein
MRDQMRDPLQNPDDLDLLLDSALATYADPGSGSGLEERVIAALAAARAGTSTRIVPRRRRWLTWAIAIPVAASLILLWVLASTRVLLGPSAQQERASLHQETPLASPHAAIPAAGQQEPARARPSRVKAHDSFPGVTARLKSCPVTKPDCARTERTLSAANDFANRAPLPKLDVFPTPQPLTPQEQALLAFAQQAPAGQVKALSAVQAEDEESFALASSHIPAFEPPAEGKN